MAFTRPGARNTWRLTPAGEAALAAPQFLLDRAAGSPRRIIEITDAGYEALASYQLRRGDTAEGGEGTPAASVGLPPTAGAGLFLGAER